MAKGWTVWSEGDARAEIALWKKSGQSLLKFTRGRGYTEARLRWWRKQLGDVPPASPTALLPVRIVDAECAAPIETQLETPIEMVLRGGHIVRVRRGFDAATLSAVVRTLEDAC